MKNLLLHTDYVVSSSSGRIKTGHLVRETRSSLAHAINNIINDIGSLQMILMSAIARGKEIREPRMDNGMYLDGKGARRESIGHNHANRRGKK